MPLPPLSRSFSATVARHYPEPIRAAACSALEGLEPRRMLAATFDAATGILDLTSGPEDAIFQFESVYEGGQARFRVIQSEGENPPAGRSQAEIDAYLDSATNAQTFGLYDEDAVRFVRIRTGGGDDLVIVGDAVNVPVDIDTAGGNDTISAGPGNDTIIGNLGNDYIYGGRGDDAITGADGDDHMLGGPGDFDSVDYKTRGTSQAVSVTLDGRANDGGSIERDNVGIDFEIIIGGQGGDLLDASTRTPRDYRNGVFVPLGPVALYGGPGSDNLRGTPLGDTLVGDIGFDNITGNAGDDLIITAEGSGDTVVAGDGDDTVVADASTSDNVTGGEVLLRPGQTFPAPETTESRATRDADGVITVTGTDQSDRITVTVDGSMLKVIVTPQAINGGSGNLTVDVFELLPEDPAEPIVSGIVVNAGEGDDLVYVGDITIGGSGGVVPGATINGGLGNDVLIGGNGSDLLDGGDETPDADTGRFGYNMLYGRGGADTLRSGFGRDDLSGNAGRDQADYSRRVDPLRIGLGGLFDDGIVGEGDNVREDIEVVLGGSGGDDLSTTTGTGVELYGYAGNDSLFGSPGADTLVGGAGRDIMAGFAGNDYFFAFDGETDTVSGGIGDDDGSFDSNDLVSFGNDG